MNPDTFLLKLRHWSAKRQLLNRRGESAEAALLAVGGVYSWHPTTAISLFARTQSLTAEEVRTLDTEKIGLRVMAMRGSVHMVHRDQVARIFGACVPGRDSGYWEKRYSQKGRDIATDVYAVGREAFLAKATAPQPAKVFKGTEPVPEDRTKMLLNWLCGVGDMLRIGATSLRSNILSYVAWEAHLGAAFEPAEATMAREWLAGQYLKAFGPVRLKDFQWWSGLKAGEAKAAFESQEKVEVAPDYWILKADFDEYEAFQALGTFGVGVNARAENEEDNGEDWVDILPQWDAYTMGYAPDGRARFVAPEHQEHIYGALGATGGNGLGTILHNGLAVGGWKARFKGTKMEVTLNLF
ncbi:MAG: crosslink repair DNA glycosylase YcaQ family protein, partial [Bacteroidota bacterium]